MPLLTLLTILMVTCVVSEDAVAQCSMCKKALEAGGQEGLIRGLAWSVVFMVIPPTLMTFGIGFLVLRSNRPHLQKPTCDLSGISESSTTSSPEE